LKVHATRAGDLPDIAARFNGFENRGAYENNLSQLRRKLFKRATHLDLRFLMMRIDFGTSTRAGARLKLLVALCKPLP
jgi:hypothetical protein